MSPADDANDTAEGAANETAGQGPAVDLPDEAPDFVGEVLDEVGAGATSLGETISEIASGADPAAATAVVAEVAAVVPL